MVPTEEGGVQRVTLSLDQLRGAQVPDVFLLDPWGQPVCLRVSAS